MWHAGRVRAFTDADRAVMTDPTFAERYRHTAAHDARVDGQFVVGWPMSETFCRPGCAARTPRPSRVTFYRTSAAAFAARLVPCPRCRPDMTPSVAELPSGETVAARALRLIDDGEIDRRGVGGVARSLGVTPRQVLRAVIAAVDCGPLDVARVRRAQLARLLLTATSLPMDDVAMAAGFATVRQFNATMQDLYRATPGTLRFGPRHATRSVPVTGAIVVRCVLPLTRPSAPGLFAGLAARAVPEVEEGGGDWYARTVRLPNGPGHVRFDRGSAGQVLAKLTAADLRDLGPLHARARRLVESCMVPAAGRMPPTVDVAEALIRATVEEHASPASSRTVLGGLAAALGEVTPWGRLFPSATAVAASGADVLRGPARRVGTVLGMARAIAAGDVDVAGGWSAAALAARHADLLGS